MSESLRMRVVEAVGPYYDCAECHRRTAPGEVHTFLFCALYKIGWSREQIIANVLFTADALREDR